jgi:hypothetical protein
MAALIGLEVGDPPSVWADLGFLVDGDVCRLGSVAISLVGSGSDSGSGSGGIISWALSGVEVDDGGLLDGLPTSVGVVDAVAAVAGSHPNGAVSIDHLVVSTPDLERTVKVFEDAGLLLRRRRDAGATYGTELHQAFFRVDDVIIEVVGPPSPSGIGVAAFFGLAITVDDLAATGSYLGDRMRPPKDAVQAGRQIATLARDAGSSVALAFMSR